MKKRPPIHRIRHAWLAALFTAALVFSPNLKAQTAADVASQQALQLFNDGKTPDAISAYEKILHDYPTSTVVPEAQFRLGYLYFQNGDFDKSMDQLKKILQPPAPAEIQELAYSLLPQVMAAKASKMPPEDAKRKPAFEDAIKQYDLFIQKYPNSDEMETIVYARALSLYQIGKYDDAAAGLRSNLTRFPKSESILDSQYLLAITLATQAVSVLQASPGDRQGFSKFDEAEKLLADIIQKRTDIALANDAQFQLGEVLLNRASMSDKAEQPALYAKAIAAYRAVEAKEPMIKAQQDRIDGLIRVMKDATVTKTLAGIRHYQRLIEHERTKLAELKTKADQTVTAKIKVAQAFYDQHRFDEARQMLHDMQQFAEDDTQNKTILYYITLTYAAQSDAEKAVSSYDEFTGKYKNDPIAENLPLIVGGVFLNPDPKINNPDKAIQYFKKEVTDYPKSRYATDALAQEATALVQQKRYDEALSAFKSLLSANPSKEIAASADLGIAMVYSQTGKLDNALTAFKGVREKYPGTPPAEQASYYVGQTLVQKGDNQNGITELSAFTSKYPESPMQPTALYYLATAEQALGQKDAALAKFKELGDKYPKNEAAQYSYFQRAGIYATAQETDQMIAVLKEFIGKYPESDKLYFAYDTIAQSLINSGKIQDAIDAYNEFVDKHPQAQQGPEALLKLADLWRGTADSQGRYLVLNEDQRAIWTKGVNGSIAAAEKLITQFPDSPQVALALQTLLGDQRLLLTAKLKTDADVQQYFQDLAKKFEDKPIAKNKVLFTLASYLYDQDKTKALEQMKAAYDPKLLYAPADLDLYGSALLEQNNVADAQKVYEKLAADYPNPPGVTPDKAPPQIAEAQSIALYGLGKCLQKQGNTKAAGEDFDNLKKWYPWSPKILEANFGIAQSLYQEKKYDDAIALLIPIMRAQAASATVDLRANAMLLGGKIQEAKGNIEPAIDYYIKIAYFYEGVPKVAAEGLWNGAQLLEKQAATLPETGKVTKSGQLAKAAKAYKDLVDKFPTSPHVDQAKQRLAALKPPGK